MKNSLIESKERSINSAQKLVNWIDPKPVFSKDLDGILRVCEPTLHGNESKYVNDCLDTGWISSHGEYINKFEKLFSEKCGAKYSVACSSGSTATHLAAYILNLSEGDEVIMPTFTMVATANSVRLTGAKPIFIDMDKRTWNMDVSKIEEKITKNTKAIMPVHVYGHPCEMDEILSIAKKYNLYVIEDAAEAHGAEYKNRKIGTIGDITIFSFFANKNITTGEGGMLVTNNEEVYEMAKKIRNQAFSEKRHFWHKHLGFNYRMTNLQAAIGLAQTERFDTLINNRIKNAKIYNALLKDIDGITLPPETLGIKNVYWMYSITIEKKFGLSTMQLREHLAKNGIETRSFFIPLHLQPIYYESSFEGKFPVSEDVFPRGFYLPSSAHLTEDEIQYVAGKIKSAIK